MQLFKAPFYGNQKKSSSTLDDILLDKSHPTFKDFRGAKCSDSPITVSEPQILTPLSEDVNKEMDCRADDKYVFTFEEGNAGMVDLLGGKGANLAEMTQLGLPVPPGFIMTTAAFHDYVERGNSLSKKILNQVSCALDYLNSKTGKTFGSLDNPLLVSVRSGAKVSMPGMMETILNIGLNDEAVKSLAKATNNPSFAYDSYKRLIKMFSNVVYGVDIKELNEFMEKKALSSPIALELAKKRLKNDLKTYDLLVEKVMKEIDSNQENELSKCTEEFANQDNDIKVKISQKGAEALSAQDAVQKESLCGKVLDVSNDLTTVLWADGDKETYPSDYLEVLRLGNPVTMNEKAHIYHHSRAGSEGKIKKWYNNTQVYIAFTKLTGYNRSSATYDVRFDTFFSDNPEIPSEKLLDGKSRDKKTAKQKEIIAKYAKIREAVRQAGESEDIASRFSKLELAIKNITPSTHPGNSYTVGDRVIGVCEHDGRDIKDLEGTVRIIDGVSIGIEFDKDMRGHDLKGSDLKGGCKHGYGWFVNAKSIRKDHLCLDNLLEQVAREKLTSLIDPELEIEIIKEFVKKETGKEFPQDPHEQLHQAIASVFKSWYAPKARSYREINNIPVDLGTAVNIQSMVFGNVSEQSFTGVAFSRNKDTGEKKVTGEYLRSAQGEDVVSGAVTPLKINSLKHHDQQVYNQLIQLVETLEHHYKDMQDIEFTYDGERLWILQTRSGKRSSMANAKISLDMLSEGLITTEEAFKRISVQDIESILTRTGLEPSDKDILLGRGEPSVGIAIGKIALSNEEAATYKLKGEPAILVRPFTDTEDIGGIRAAVGVITATGGATSHAAIVAKGMNKVCIPGCENLEVRCPGDGGEGHNEVRFKSGGSLTTLYSGDWISLDGHTGKIYKGRIKTTRLEDKPEIQQLENILFGMCSPEDTLLSVSSADNLKFADNKNIRIGVFNSAPWFVGNGNLDKLKEYIQSQGKEEFPREVIDAIANNYAAIFKAILMDRRVIYCGLLEEGYKAFIPATNEMQPFYSFVRATERMFTPEFVQSMMQHFEVASKINSNSSQKDKALDYGFIEAQVQAIALGAKKAHIKLEPEENESHCLAISIPTNLSDKYGREEVDRLVNTTLQKITGQCNRDNNYGHGIQIVSDVENNALVFEPQEFLTKAFEYHSNRMARAAVNDTQ